MKNKEMQKKNLILFNYKDLCEYLENKQLNF